MNRINKTGIRIATVLGAGLVAACTVQKPDTQANRDATAKEIIEQVKTTPDGTSTANSLDDYKADLARRISQVNSTKVHIERPQALLRSVIVIKYVVDKDGNLVRSEVVRTNKDKVTESTALTTLRNTAPFPKPPIALLSNGRIELSETWLFNNDGRFQLRTIAQPQKNE
ncbi:energy transducer TonB [Herbaspirillum sp. meg3]|uniref:energy transducer TonB family protein n=1 Tax=Herbaspirillum sp. meg3 TaxID=2025949 RepID=UPI001E583E95|nr:TonB C-terminal domain-containing protein [Herbaspirillum sp. meg3]